MRLTAFTDNFAAILQRNSLILGSDDGKFELVIVRVNLQLNRKATNYKLKKNENQANKAKEHKKNCLSYDRQKDYHLD